MQAEGHRVYELWPSDTVNIPPRSRLFHLPPIGQGTAGVECLTSYISRLAKEHCVSTRDLVSRIIEPAIGKKYLSGAGLGVESATSSDVGVNGTGTMATDWVHAVETLTHRRDLSCLTLLALGDVLPTRGLMRCYRAWCPDCYQEWFDQGQEIYEPLLWCLTEVTVCPCHRSRLVSICPHAGCGGKSKWLGGGLPGCCPRCDGWLGATQTGGTEDLSPQPDEEMRVWCAEQVADLISITQRVSKVPRRQVSNAMGALAAQLNESNIAQFARLLDLPKNTVWLWCNGQVLPTLSMLLRVTWRLDLPLSTLLTKAHFCVLPTQQRTLTQRQKRIQRRFDPDPVRLSLEKMLHADPPVSVVKAAKALGYGPRHLRRHFPQLTAQVAARYMAYVEDSKRIWEERTQEAVRAVVRTLHAQGVYPSARKVHSFLPKPVSLKNRTAKAAWSATLQELGIK